MRFDEFPVGECIHMPVLDALQFQGTEAPVLGAIPDLFLSTSSSDCLFVSSVMSLVRN